MTTKEMIDMYPKATPAEVASLMTTIVIEELTSKGYFKQSECCHVWRIAILETAAWAPGVFADNYEFAHYLATKMWAEMMGSDSVCPLTMVPVPRGWEEVEA